jgi:hypothetical protein
MSELGDLIAQVKNFAKIRVPELSGRLVERLTGSQVAMNLEKAKNKCVVEALSEEIRTDETQRCLNAYLIAGIKFAEVKIDTQRLVDFASTIGKLIDEKSSASAEVAEALSDFKKLLADPRGFVEEMLRLRDETEQLEDRLSCHVSIPLLYETAVLKSAGEMVQLGTERFNCEISQRLPNSADRTQLEPAKAATCLRIVRS